MKLSDCPGSGADARSRIILERKMNQQEEAEKAENQ
jgi:hypothetical protein